MRTRFYQAGKGTRALTRTALRLGDVRDVYVGCALRAQQRGGRAHIGQAWALWAECDGPAAGASLETFGFPPSLAIASGTPGHVHAYWALAESIGVDALEDANRRLAAAVGGDPVCFDAARILRPPGTRNHKHTPPRCVRQIGPLHPEPYRLDSILDALPELSTYSTTRSEPRAPAADPLLRIEPGRYVALLTGREVGRDHKVSCPFHEERTPSLHVYPTAERGWFCFGCRRGGSIYDLAAALWQMESRGSDFHALGDRLRRLFAQAP